MATVSSWTPFGVALDITATAGTVTRTSATQYKVVINASWETHYSGAKTNYGMSASSGGGSVTLNASGNKSEGSSGSFTGTYTISGNGSATKTITVTFRNFNNDNSNAATKTVSFNVTVPAWTSYTVSYNANGGTGAPSNQTKWKDQALTLSSTKPTRTGYTFKGWATSASGSVAYAAGASYTGNAALTLYAVWQAITYTVSYNANGGTGAPANQTKTYGVNLTLSSTKPTMTNYKFLGWGTSANATTVAYVSGASYTTNAAVTLYAVWELAYTPPTITDLSVTRCDADGNPDDFGESIKVSFNWSCDQNLGANDISSIAIRYRETTASEYTEESVSVSGTSGTVSHVISGGGAGGDTLTWDGDTTGLVSVEAMGNMYYKLSSAVPTIEEFNVGSTLKMTNGVDSVVLTENKVSGEIDGFILGLDGAFAVIPTDNFEISQGEGMTLNYPEKGVYFTVHDGTYPSSLTINGYTGFGGGGVSISLETSYDVQVVATDSENGTTTLNSVVAVANFPIDILAGGTGVAFGKPAELEGVAETAYQTLMSGGIKHPTLEAGTDLNNVKTPNTYIGANVASNNYANCPLTSGTFTLTVEGAGEEGQIKQILSRCSMSEPNRYHRYFYQNTWGEWVSDIPAVIYVQETGADLNNYKMTGTYYFNTSHTPLNVPSGCVNGWLVVIRADSGAIKQLWHRYGTLNTNDFNTFVRTGNGTTWSNWKRYSYEPDVLYDNSSGTTGTVTLSESAENFSAIEVFYCDNNGSDRTSVRVQSPNGKYVSLSTIEASTATKTNIRRTRYLISGTSMTTLTTNGYVQLNPSEYPWYGGTANYIKVLKVVGYR